MRTLELWQRLFLLRWRSRVRFTRVFAAGVWTHGQASLERSCQSPQTHDETFSVWCPHGSIGSVKIELNSYPEEPADVHLKTLALSQSLRAKPSCRVRDETDEYLDHERKGSGRQTSHLTRFSNRSCETCDRVETQGAELRPELKSYATALNLRRISGTARDSCEILGGCPLGFPFGWLDVLVVVVSS